MRSARFKAPVSKIFKLLNWFLYEKNICVARRKQIFKSKQCCIVSVSVGC